MAWSTLPCHTVRVRAHTLATFFLLTAYIESPDKYLTITVQHVSASSFQTLKFGGDAIAKSSLPPALTPYGSCGRRTQAQKHAYTPRKFLPVNKMTRLIYAASIPAAVYLFLTQAPRYFS